jgi:hypothetical protein
MNQARMHTNRVAREKSERSEHLKVIAFGVFAGIVAVAALLFAVS